jgi:hypothetical protein
MGDPATDILQVSGFYGPGTWAAWLITLLASWIPILRNDYTSNLHYISYALYTNWAAIDLMRQTPKYVFRFKDALENPILISQQEPMAASFAVAGLGAAHAYLQYLVCFRHYDREKRLGNRDTKAVIWRIRVILLGIALPAIVAFVALFGSLLNFEMDSELSMNFQLFMYCSTVASVVYGETLFWKYFVAGIMSVLYLSRILSVAFFPEVQSWRCYVIPCAPQLIGEWDQAFALFLALFVFVYEFGVESVRFVWKKINNDPGNEALSKLESDASTPVSSNSYGAQPVRSSTN